MGATLHTPFSKRFARDSSGVASPHGKFCFELGEGEAIAAFSHSASVGKRLPAHFANADASRKLTCETGSCALSTARCNPAKSRIIHSPSCSQYKGACQCSLFTFYQPAECHQRKSL